MCGVIVLCGLPGSGKSYKSLELKSAFEKSGIPARIVESDYLQSRTQKELSFHSGDLRFDSETDSKGYVFDPSSLLLFREEFQTFVERLLCEASKDSVIILDGDFLAPGSRKRVEKLCRKNCAGFISVRVVAPLSLCLQRNLSRPKRIDPDEIQAQSNRMAEGCGDFDVEVEGAEALTSSAFEAIQNQLTQARIKAEELALRSAEPPIQSAPGPIPPIAEIEPALRKAVGEFLKLWPAKGDQVARLKRIFLKKIKEESPDLGRQPGDLERAALDFKTFLADQLRPDPSLTNPTSNS